MTLEPLILAAIVGVGMIIFDCNRRLRILQHTSDVHTEWLDTLIANTAKPLPPDLPPGITERRRPQ
jgi:hypothetical protein